MTPHHYQNSSLIFSINLHNESLYLYLLELYLWHFLRLFFLSKFSYLFWRIWYRTALVTQPHCLHEFTWWPRSFYQHDPTCGWQDSLPPPDDHGPPALDDMKNGMRNTDAEGKGDSQPQLASHPIWSHCMFPSHCSYPLYWYLLAIGWRYYTHSWNRQLCCPHCHASVPLLKGFCLPRLKFNQGQGNRPA